MTVITSNQGGLGYPLGGINTPPLTQQEQLANLSDQNRTEVQQMVLQFIQGAQQTGGTPGVNDANGAPQIDGVVLSFSAEDLGDALRLLGNKTKEGQLKSAKEGLLVSKEKMAENHKEAIKKIEEYAKKCVEEKHSGLIKKIFSWIGKCLAVIGAAIAVGIAAVATVATGGAAAPALIIAGIAMASAVISLASAISQECGGPALELSSLLSKAFGAVLEAFGVPKEKAESLGKLLSGIVGIAVGGGAALLLDPAFAANMVGGAMELGGVDADTVAKVTMVVTIVTAVTVGIAAAVVSCGASSVGAAANAAGTATNTISSAVRSGAAIAQGVTTVATGATGIGSGAAGIAQAQSRHEADMAMVDKKKIDAMTVALMKSMEEDSEEMKKILKEIEESLESISSILAGSAQNHSDIAANINSRAAV
ncbi:MAG: outer protein [Proteobacteria bacterium]|nr:outer protein [Pseudomonadota bacterium]